MSAGEPGDPSPQPGSAADAQPAADGHQGSNGTEPGDGDEPRSFVSVVVHSFFIIPFLIAIFAGLLFVTVRILTNEPQTVYDYLGDVKAGGATKRWQAAFELSKILADPRRIPDEPRFVNEVLAAFDQAEHDDPRVRQYLALAMARSGREAFIAPLTAALEEAPEGTQFMLLVSLGMFGTDTVVDDITPYLDHPAARVRSGAATALGLTAAPTAIASLQRALQDVEPAVGWDAALALARLGDLSGKTTLLALLDRSHLAQFPNVDDRDQNLLMATVIEVVAPLGDPQLNARIESLAREDPSLDVRRVAQQMSAP